MSIRNATLLLGAFCVLVPLGAAQSVWRDNLDSYTIGPWAGQGGWSEWAGSSGVSGDITSAFALSGTLSGVIFGDDGINPDPDDTVYDFVQLPTGEPGAGFGTKGVWATTINTYLPSDSTGTAFIQMQNDYPEGAGGELSREVIWSVNTGLVADTTGRGGTRTNRPIRYDQWVPMTVVVNLDTRRTDVFYAGERVNVDSVWTNDNSRRKISALRLFAGLGNGAITEMYFDDMCLEQVSGPEAIGLSMTPNPIFPGDNMRLDTDAPELANTAAALFVNSVSGFPFITPVLFFSFDSNGTFGFDAAIPLGTPPASVGFRIYAPGSSGLAESNEMVLHFQ